MVYLAKDELADSYKTAKTSAKQWFKDFPEYERIAANKVRKDIPANMPKVNDGSLAALLVESPNSILNGQEPSGSVKVVDRDEAWLGELANIEWKTEITKKANTQAFFLSKCVQVIEKSLIYGAQPTVSLFVQRGNYIGADFYLPYVADIILEPGKLSDQDCAYIFENVWYTPLQLKNIIERAKEEEKAAKAEKRESYNKWDVKVLQAALDEGAKAKSTEEQNQKERESETSNKPGGIKFVKVYQRGVEAPFYMITEKGDCARTWQNQDPTGDMPVHLMYCHQNLTNPYGKGKVELAGGTQNVLDYITQAHVLATQIGFQPPLKIMGGPENVDLASLVYAPNQPWFLGDTQVEQAQTSGPIYAQMGNTYGLYKTQLMNSIGRTDGGSVSGESGNPQFSKTPTGINTQQERTQQNDNAIWKNFGLWFEANARSMLNIHFANMQGTDVRKLLDDDRDRLFRSAPEQFQTLQDTNELEVIWDYVRANFDFDIDPSSNEIKDEKAQIEGLTTLTETLPTAMQALSMDGYEVHPGEAYKEFYTKLGIDNIDKIIVKVTPEEAAANQAQAGVPGGEVPPVPGAPAQPGAPMGPEGMVQPQPGAAAPMAPAMDPNAPLEPAMQVAPAEAQPAEVGAEQEIEMIMTEYGLDQEEAIVVHNALRAGVTVPEVQQYIAEYLKAKQGVPVNG